MDAKSRVGLPHLGGGRAASLSPQRKEMGALEDQAKTGLSGELTHKKRYIHTHTHTHQGGQFVFI